MAIDIDEAKVNRNEFGLWLGWTLATVAGMLLGLLPFLLFVQDLDVALVRVLIPLWAGFLVGVFQWLALRNYLTHSVDWILNGGGGWAVGFALGLLAIQLLGGTPFGVILSYILFGAIIAIFQWPVLRREIPHLLPWLIANILGWALGAYLSTLILGLFVNVETANQALSTAVVAGLTGLIAGAITGAALVYIVRQPERQVLRR